MSKIIFVIFRKSDLSHVQCMQEWAGERHVGLVKNLPGLEKWVLNDTIPNADGKPDGIGELWFENDNARDIAMNSPQMATAGEDAARFLDMNKTYAILASEKTLVGS